MAPWRAWLLRCCQTIQFPKKRTSFSHGAEESKVNGTPRPKFYARVNMMREKGYLNSSPNLHDGLVVSANVLESFPKALANFAYLASKPYVIDPVTYFFGPAPINYTGKKWWADLQDAFGVNQILPPAMSGFIPDQLVDGSDRATRNLELFVR